jgi:hypothetical protein
VQEWSEPAHNQAGKSIAIDSILYTFVYYLLLKFYQDNIEKEDSKENIAPNSDFVKKMVPSLSLILSEQKPAACQQIATLMTPAPFVQAAYHQPAQVVPLNQYALMPAQQNFLAQYFSAPPAPHPGYQPHPQVQPVVYYQPQAAPMHYMATHPMYHPYAQQPPQPVVSFPQPTPHSGYPLQQGVYYQVAYSPGPTQYAHPYPYQPSAVTHYSFPMQHPPTEGV